jgi:hypothetical protein
MIKKIGMVSLTVIRGITVSLAGCLGLLGFLVNLSYFY